MHIHKAIEQHVLFEMKKRTLLTNRESSNFLNMLMHFEEKLVRLLLLHSLNVEEIELQIQSLKYTVIEFYFSFFSELNSIIACVMYDSSLLFTFDLTVENSIIFGTILGNLSAFSFL